MYSRRNSASERRQRGEGKVKAIIYTLILAVGVYAAIKIVPVYVANYELKDKITEQARFAVVNRYPEDQVRETIFKVIQDLDIPAKREDIKVATTTHGMEISVTYTVPLDLTFYKTELTFTPSSEVRDLMK